jgi:hypothetical protein
VQPEPLEAIALLRYVQLSLCESNWHSDEHSDTVMRLTHSELSEGLSVSCIVLFFCFRLRLG